MNFQRIPRIEDLPYYHSKPVEFIYQSTAPLIGGVYTWADGPTPLAALRPLQSNTLYYFRTVTMTANISQDDYTACINVLPGFQMFLKSQANQILFREPLYMGMYLQNFDYRFCFISSVENDQLNASFTGSLAQNTNLVGIPSITLTVVISAQEVTDDSFISYFTQKYPGEKNNDYMDIMMGRKK